MEITRYYCDWCGHSVPTDGLKSIEIYGNLNRQHICDPCYDAVQGLKNQLSKNIDSSPLAEKSKIENS